MKGSVLGIKKRREEERTEKKERKNQGNSYARLVVVGARVRRLAIQLKLD